MDKKQKAYIWIGAGIFSILIAMFLKLVFGGTVVLGVYTGYGGMLLVLIGLYKRFIS